LFVCLFVFFLVLRGIPGSTPDTSHVVSLVTDLEQPATRLLSATSTLGEEGFVDAPATPLSAKLGRPNFEVVEGVITYQRTSCRTSASRRRKGVHGNPKLLVCFVLARMHCVQFPSLGKGRRDGKKTWPRQVGQGVGSCKTGAVALLGSLR